MKPTSRRTFGQAPATPRFSRRDFGRHLGAAATALPILEATNRAAAQQAFPKRLVILFSPNGTIREAWSPTGTEESFTLSRILKPLEPHKQDLLILDGVKNETAQHGPGDGHMTGMGTLLTGTELLPGTQFKCGGTDPCSGYGGGISIDQFIANQLKPPTKFRTLELAVQPGSATVWSRMCYAGSDQPLAPQEDPVKIFNNLFGALDTSAADLDRLRRQRQSVLDYVTARIGVWRQRLGAEDRAKLDAHLTSVREIERRLQAQVTSCVKPTAPAGSFTGNDNYPKAVQAMSELTARAFACDLTRVVTIQWSRSVGDTRMTWLGNGITRGHHDISHDGDSVAQSVEWLTQINTWYAEQVAYLLAQLKSIPEGGGSALDNTVVVWVNELGRGNSHTRSFIPFVLAGSCGKYFRTGRYVKYTSGDWHNNLLVSLANAMDVPITTFGNPAYCKGPLRLLT